MHQRSLSRLTLLFLLIVPVVLPAQQTPEAQQVIQAVLQSQRKLRHVQYSIRAVDTLVTGHTSDYTGACDMMPDTTDSLFGFSFRANQHRLPSATIYTAGRAFELNTEKHTYTMNLRPNKGILGFPGGQMVFADLIRLDTSKAIKTSVTEEGNRFVLRFDYPDLTEYNVEQRYKLVFINKNNMLPAGSYSYQVTLGKRQIIILDLQSLLVNQEIKDPFDFAGKQYLKDYTLKENTHGKPAYLSLLNQPAPAMQLQDFNGNNVTLSEMTGKVVLLDFWEVWCGPCVTSMPKVEALYKKYKDKGLAVMGVMCDSSQLEPARQLVAKNHYSFPQLIGNAGTRKNYKLNAVPMYALINKAGAISYIHAGFEETLEEQIRKALE